MTKVQRAVAFLIIQALMIVAASGCSTGGILQVGYLPVSSIDHREQLKSTK